MWIKFLKFILFVLCKASLTKGMPIYCLTLSNQSIEAASTDSEIREKAGNPMFGNLGPEYFFWRHNLSKLNTLPPHYFSIEVYD